MTWLIIFVDFWLTLDEIMTSLEKWINPTTALHRSWSSDVPTPQTSRRGNWNGSTNGQLTGLEQPYQLISMQIVYKSCHFAIHHPNPPRIPRPKVSWHLSNLDLQIWIAVDHKFSGVASSISDVFWKRLHTLGLSRCFGRISICDTMTTPPGVPRKHTTILSGQGCPPPSHHPIIPRSKDRTKHQGHNFDHWGW